MMDVMDSFPCYAEDNYPRYMAISAPGVMAFINLEGLYLLSRTTCNIFFYRYMTGKGRAANLDLCSALS